MAPNKVTHYIPVMNLSDATWTLHEGTRLGDVFPVELLKQVQEMLWVDSGLSDWDSDDEELIDVRQVSQVEMCLKRHLVLTPGMICTGGSQRLARASRGVDCRRYFHSGAQGASSGHF